MSITWLSSKRFTQKSMYIFTLYRTSVIILKPLHLHPHIHSTVKLCRKDVLQTKREAFFKRNLNISGCVGLFLHTSNILSTNSLSKVVYLRFFNRRLEPGTLKMSDYLTMTGPLSLIRKNPLSLSYGCIHIFSLSSVLCHIRCSLSTT